MSALGAALVFGESIARDVHGSLKESVKRIKALREFPEHAEDLGLTVAGDVLVPEYVNDVPGYLVANDMTTIWQASLKKTLQDKVPEARFSATELEQECERVWTLIDEEYLQAAGARVNTKTQVPMAEKPKERTADTPPGKRSGKGGRKALGEKEAAEAEATPGKWSRYMPLTQIAERLFKDGKKWRKVKKLYADILEQKGRKGSKDWRIRLDGFDEDTQNLFDRP